MDLIHAISSGSVGPSPASSGAPACIAGPVDLHAIQLAFTENSAALSRETIRSCRLNTSYIRMVHQESGAEEARISKPLILEIS